MATIALAPNGPAKRIRPHHDWPSAFRALRKLLANTEDTSQVFEIMRALNGQAHARGYARLLETADGGRIAYERVELAERLMDDSWRATFPPGSVGAAYADFLASEHLSAKGLIDESHKGTVDSDLDPRHPHAWFARRIRDLHDIWHVLTGYHRDALGELCLVTFSYQETHGLGWALITLGGFLRAHGPVAAQARKAVFEARKRGRQTIWLPGEDYEKVLFEPLESARRRLGIEPAPAYGAMSPSERQLSVTR
jgi:ubiquinone biosynthesis protein COQ4